jgi:hypothetical protein
MGAEFIFGLITDVMMVNGSIIKCMERVSSPGLMAADMKENTSMIKNKAEEFSSGLMAESTMVCGSMVNSMERAFIILLSRR